MVALFLVGLGLTTITTAKATLDLQEELVSRVLKAWPLVHADMDDATLQKPGNLATAARSPLPVRSPSQLPSLVAPGSLTLTRPGTISSPSPRWAPPPVCCFKPPRPYHKKRGYSSSGRKITSRQMWLEGSARSRMKFANITVNVQFVGSYPQPDQMVTAFKYDDILPEIAMVGHSDVSRVAALNILWAGKTPKRVVVERADKINLFLIQRTCTIANLPRGFMFDWENADGTKEDLAEGEKYKVGNYVATRKFWKGQRFNGQELLKMALVFVDAERDLPPSTIKLLEYFKEKKVATKVIGTFDDFNLAGENGKKLRASLGDWQEGMVFFHPKTGAGGQQLWQEAIKMVPPRPAPPVWVRDPAIAEKDPEFKMPEDAGESAYAKWKAQKNANVPAMQ